MKLLLTTIAAVLVVGCGPSISIHKAAEEGNIEVVKQHLAAGTDVNVKDDEVGTPLHLAAVFSKEVTELLIANGADVNAKDKYGGTPLDYANNEVAKILINNGAMTSDELKVDERKLVAASRDGDIQKVKSYLAVGVDVNNIDEDGHTPLHWNINNESIEVLIAKGANVNTISKHGLTPLDMAIKRNHTETADLLRKHGGKTGEELKKNITHQNLTLQHPRTND